MLACNLGFFFDSICHETFISEAAESEKGCLLIYDIFMTSECTYQYYKILQWGFDYFLCLLQIKKQSSVSLYSIKLLVCYAVFLVFTLIKAYGLLVFYSIKFPSPWMCGGYLKILSIRDDSSNWK